MHPGPVMRGVKGHFAAVQGDLPAWVVKYRPAASWECRVFHQSRLVGAQNALVNRDYPALEVGNSASLKSRDIVCHDGVKELNPPRVSVLQRTAIAGDIIFQDCIILESQKPAFPVNDRTSTVCRVAVKAATTHRRLGCIVESTAVAAITDRKSVV